MYKQLLIGSLAALSLFSCKKDDKGNPDATDNYDRASLLQNIGNNLIIPNYLDLKLETDTLYSLTQVFIGSPIVSNLDALRDQLLETQKAWMHCSVFEFGPAANTVLRMSVNTFPTDTTQIQNNINTGTWDFSIASNIDAIGFPSLDFLLNDLSGNDAAILNKFTSGTNAANRKLYLNDIVADLQLRFYTVYSDWIASGGNYISTFVNSTGTDVGSSLSFLVNQLNYDYEILKNPRIGIPLGKQTLDIPLPDKCENYFNGNSLQLAIEQVTALENIFRGRTKAGVDGSGIDDYLDYRGAQTNGTALSVAVNNKFGEITTALQNIPGVLRDEVVNNPAIVNVAYTRILEGLILLKTEVPSALGILITYQDSDGD